MIRKSLIFIIQSHLFLAISSFVFSQGILSKQPNSLYFSLALAFAVFGVYNLNRLNKLKRNLLHEESWFWYNKNKQSLLYFSILSLILAGFFFIFLMKNNILLYMLLSVFGMITLSYIFSLKHFDVRQIPGTKAIWIAMVWTCVAIVIPKLIYNSIEWSDINYFLLFFALTIPGDIRDCKLDNPKMKTIPQLIGNQNAEILFYLLIVFFLMLDYLIHSRSLIEMIFIFLFVLILFRFRSHFRYELFDGMLFVLGVCYMWA